MISTFAAERIGLEHCAAPFAGLVLLGVKGVSGTSSSWFGLDFEGPGVELREVQYYVSPNESFPDPSLIRERQPVLIAAADGAHWRELELADEKAFLRALLQGDFELGGNFSRYRQHLEWLLENATSLRITAVADELSRIS